jgi:hypothetical protein
MLQKHRHRRLFMTIAGAHLLAGLSITFLCRRWMPREELLALLMLGVVLAQSGLVSLWAVFSTRRLTLRWAGVIGAAVLLWAELLTAVRGWGSLHQSGEALIFVLPPIVVAFILAALLRSRGVRCHRVTAFASDTRIETLQFSLTHLMLLILAVGVLLTIVRAVRGTGPIMSVTTGFMIATLVGAQFATQTLTCLWAALGFGRSLWRLPVPLLLGAVNSAVFGFVTGSSGSRYLGWLCISETKALVILVMLFAVRWAGYRLVRRSEESAAASVL